MTATRNGGWPLTSAGRLGVDTVAASAFDGGLPLVATGELAATAVSTGAKWDGGLLLSPTGRLVFSTGAIVGNLNGWPVDANLVPVAAEGGTIAGWRNGLPVNSAGAVCTTGLSGGVSGFSTAVLADSPVSYWRFEDVSLPSAVDAQGVNAGTFVNSPTLGATGALTDSTKGVGFASASSQYVTVPASGSLNTIGGDVFTLECWAKRAAIGVTHALFSKGTGSFFVCLNASNQLELDNEGNVVQVVSTITVTDLLFHHYAVTKNGAGTVKLYIDGADVTGTVTPSAFGNPNQLMNIGRRASFSDSHFNGTIDEPAVYATALSAARIAAHYAAR